MDRTITTPEALEEQAASAESLSEAQALAAEADRLRRMATRQQSKSTGLPLLRN